MTRRELLERQKKIDQGIVLAQKRMVRYATQMQYKLVVYRQNHIMEVAAEDIVF